MSINNVPFLNIKTMQENDFLGNLRPISLSVLNDKLNNSLDSECFKTVLSDASETDFVKTKSQIVTQSNGDKRDIKKPENNDENLNDKRTEELPLHPVLILQEEALPNSLIEPIPIDSSFIKESLESTHSFNINQDVSEQLLFDDFKMEPDAFSEFIVMQSVVLQENYKKNQCVEHDIEHGVDYESLSISEADTQIFLSPEGFNFNTRVDQPMDIAALGNMPADQQLSPPKIVVSFMTPMQTIPSLITPILLSNSDLVNEDFFEIDSDLSIDAGSTTGKPTSFVEASQHQKQLLNKNKENGSEDNSEKSFKGMGSDAQKVSTNAVDSVQRAVEVQKLTQMIRDRVQDSIKESKSNVNLNVKGIKTALGEVELDLKIANKKISVRLSSENKSMQTLLNQERSNIESILNALIDSTEESEYMLADVPVEICHQEKGI